MKKQTVAYHEAGHSVVAHGLGYQVDDVSIVCKEARGRAKLPNPMHRKDPELAQHRILLEHTAIIALAGPIAQKRHSPRSDWRGSGSGYGEFMTQGADFQIVSRLITRVHCEGKVAETFWRYLEAQAEHLVNRNWPAIERVAQALLKHGALSGDEVRAEIRLSAEKAKT
jgi:ATP-dependent Zn protease